MDAGARNRVCCCSRDHLGCKRTECFAAELVGTRDSPIGTYAGATPATSSGQPRHVGVTGSQSPSQMHKSLAHPQGATRPQQQRSVPCSVLRADPPVGTEPRPRHAVPGDAFDSAAARSSAAGTSSEDDLDRISSGARASSSGRALGSQLTLSRHEPRLARDGPPLDRLDLPWSITAAEPDCPLTDLDQRTPYTADVDQRRAGGSNVRRGLGREDDIQDAQQQAADAADSGPVTGEPGEPSDPDRPATELIFRLERRGDGWGEEIFPHLVLEQRPLEPPRRRLRKRSSRPDPWEVRRRQQHAVVVVQPRAQGSRIASAH